MSILNCIINVPCKYSLDTIMYNQIIYYLHRATPRRLTYGPWAVSWQRCCPTSRCTRASTTWTSSTWSSASAAPPPRTTLTASSMKRYPSPLTQHWPSPPPPPPPLPACGTWVSATWAKLQLILADFNCIISEKVPLPTHPTLTQLPPPLPPWGTWVSTPCTKLYFHPRYLWFTDRERLLTALSMKRYPQPSSLTPILTLLPLSLT